MTETLSLDRYRLLGRSGLRVSPLALGAMTFGTDWGWGADHVEARRIFDTYVDHGGNFIDTANQYTNGTSEKLIGRFASDKRDRLIIATKYTLPIRAGDPNSGGNHRKSMVLSLEASLRHLATDYVDLLYVHAWDGTTHVDEVLRALDDLIRSGKLLCVGISNTPAWQISRMQLMSELRGWSQFIALQLEYNLIERAGERDLIPMARELGLTVISSSPLANGVLAGKYTRSDLAESTNQGRAENSRKGLLLASGKLSAAALTIAELVKNIAVEIGSSASQVALAWLLQTSNVNVPIIGARTQKQLEDNIRALHVRLTEPQLTRLSNASAIPLGYPHDFLAYLLSSPFMSDCMNISTRRRHSTV